MSKLSIQQKRTLRVTMMKLLDDPYPDQSPQPSFAVLDSEGVLGCINIFSRVMTFLSQNKAHDIPFSSFASNMIAIAEIWGYLETRSTIEDRHKIQVNYIKWFARLAMLTLIFSERPLDKYSSLPQPIYLSYPVLVTDAKPLVEHMNRWIMHEGKERFTLIIALIEELAFVWDKTFLSDSSTSQFKKADMKIALRMACARDGSPLPAHILSL